MAKNKKTITKKPSVNKKSAKRPVSRSVVANKTSVKASELETPKASLNLENASTGFKIEKYRVVGLVLIFIVFLFFIANKNRNLFFAATVNGRPITRLELDQRMVSRYGQATTEEIISEVLIRDEANKKGLKVTAAEVDTKIAEITKNIGANGNLVDLLAQQGMTMTDLRSQIELQLLVEKLTVGLVNVSDREVTDYLDKNRSSFSATSEAELRTEAMDSLVSQKRGESLQKWFNDLKSKAKITKYL